MGFVFAVIILLIFGIKDQVETKEQKRIKEEFHQKMKEINELSEKYKNNIF